MSPLPEAVHAAENAVVQLAAYPIYFPLYIGEFEFDPTETGEKTRRVTVVMDAHDESVSAAMRMARSSLTKT